MGVQWGVLSDGNRYVLYNSRGGTSFDDQKFLVLDIKTVDTDSGFAIEEFVRHLVTLLSRQSLGQALTAKAVTTLEVREHGGRERQREPSLRVLRPHLRGGGGLA